MHENLDPSITEYLTRTDKRYSHRSSYPEKTTICYLALPTRTAHWKVRPDPMCRPLEDRCFGNSASSMLLDRDSMSLTEKDKQRFTQALKQLALKASVHPSQLRETLSAASATRSTSLSSTQVPLSASDQNVSAEEKTEGDEAIKKHIKDLETSTWPKLMLLVSEVGHHKP